MEPAIALFVSPIAAAYRTVEYINAPVVINKMGYKRSFRGKVLKVIREDQETKRVIQTRQNFFGNASPDIFTVVGQNSSGDNAWNAYVWSIHLSLIHI